MERNRRNLIPIGIVVALILIISAASNYYVDWLWFQSLDYSSVFTTTVLTKIAVFAASFLLAFIIIYFNLRVCQKGFKPWDWSSRTEDGRDILYLNENVKTLGQQLLQSKRISWVFLGLAAFGGLMVASMSVDSWLTVQMYLKQVPYGLSDPIFSKDLSFYFFVLPFFQLIYGTLMVTLILTLGVVGLVYVINIGPDLIFKEWGDMDHIKKHAFAILAAIFLLQAWGYFLSAYGILYSTSGIVFGATYADIHAKLLSYRVLLVTALALAGIFIANMFINKSRIIFIGIGTWIAVAILLGGVYPLALQNFVVQPNEFNREQEYINYAIEFTREAYALDRIKTQEVEIDYNLTSEAIDNNRATIDNIRLWDWEPLKDTYRSLQELRLYYVFNDIDIDRYTIDGRYRQVMLSARELDQQDLPAQAQTWVNQKLIYTHGYGIAMSPVNEVAPQSGFPEFIIKDIPPQFSTDLTITRPEIYFGERTDNNVMVNTLQQEFDYPMGDQNVFTTYEGDKGIRINSYFRKLAIGWNLRDYRLLLSSDITNDSQLLMNRSIITRVKKLAPYLYFDQDPYIVINDDGHLYWILDAYTFTNKYPYSEPVSNQINYMRNAVKVVCNAYSGEMQFYITDQEDPIIQTYQNIFPDLYLPLEEMPPSLQAHMRYPVDFFSVQAEMYSTFHMQDTWVFYNKEDKWVVPNEIIMNQERKMEPYYMIMRLPGEDKEEFILMLPYTPNGRPNMIAWLCARMDGDHYGSLLVYNFPKQETVYGPMQIESRINQNTFISQQIALWDQRGSRVYRGNLLVIPIENSILYVEPLYLQAETSSLPELKRIIVAYGNLVVMEETLEAALTSIFGALEDGRIDAVIPPPALDEDGILVPLPQDLQALVLEARDYYDRANAALRAGDWSGYGSNIDRLNETLKKLEQGVAE